MRRLAEAAWFFVCLTLGRMLRSARYADVQVITRDDVREVRKRRRSHAPLLIRVGNPLVAILNTGVRVLPRRDWEKRERVLYRELHHASIQVESDGTLVLPYLPGVTLATLLEDHQLEQTVRRDAIEHAVVTLLELHDCGFTHGDAMAENVMIDVATGVAHWFDFETVHDARRPPVWRRADDVRALLATCLLRTSPGELDRTLHHILNVYADEEVARLVAAGFASVWQRPLIFHLGQAGMSLARYREIGCLLRARAE